MNDRDPVTVLASLERRVIWTEVVQMWDVGTIKFGHRNVKKTTTKNLRYVTLTLAVLQQR